MPIVSFLTSAGLGLAVPLFLVATVMVAFFAPRLTKVVDALAARTTLGRSLAGSILLGASTSLPGIVVTTVAALRGDAALAAANAIGGIVAQTTFLGVADAAQRREALFRKTASPKALVQLGVLLMLLAVPLFAISGWPTASMGPVHPASLALVAVYVVGIWVARRTPEKQEDEDEEDQQGDDQQHDDKRGDDQPDNDQQSGEISKARLWGLYAVYVILIGVAGFIISTTIDPIAGALGLSSVAAGALITALATSSPELITAITAARRRQLHLAVGDIVGGNSFDVLFLAVADLAFMGAFYQQIGSSTVLLLAAAVLLNALVLLGFARRRPSHPVNPESIVILALYVALAVLLLIGSPSGGGPPGQ